MMFTAAAHQGFVRSLVVAQQATAVLTRAALIRTATSAQARVLSEQTSRAGIAPLERVIIDGRASVGFDSVKAGSRIVLLWSYLREAVAGARDAVSGREPRVTGRLIADITLFVDGQDTEGTDLDAITFDTREVELISTAPYARRIEHSVHGGRVRRRIVSGTPLSPAGYAVFESEALILRRQFAGMASFNFAYREVGLAGVVSWKRGGRAIEMSYPTIIVTPRIQ